MQVYVADHIRLKQNGTLSTSRQATLMEEPVFIYAHQIIQANAVFQIQDGAIILRCRHEEFVAIRHACF